MKKKAGELNESGQADRIFGKAPNVSKPRSGGR